MHFWQEGNSKQGDRTMSAKRAILLVEDDQSLRDTLAEQLAEDHGFSVTVAATLDEAGKAFNNVGAKGT